MTSDPYVYIIILNWNGKEDTLACLNSLRNIAYSNRKTCVVDNASSDGSVAAIRAQFPECEIIENLENLRFAKGNNIGIEHALKSGAEYVLLLNNDTTVDSKFLGELVSVAESVHDVGMVGPKIYHHEPPDLIWSAGGTISFWRGKIAHRGLRKKDAPEFNRISEVDYLTACAVLVKRKVIEQVGLLDPNYFIYGEDVDWCERAKRQGFKLFYVPDSKIWHKISTSSGGGLTGFKVVHKIRSNFMFFKRYARWYHWLTIPGFIALATIGFSVQQLVQGNFRILRSLLKGFSTATRQTQDHAT